MEVKRSMEVKGSMEATEIHGDYRNPWRLQKTMEVPGELQIWGVPPPEAACRGVRALWEVCE